LGEPVSSSGRGTVLVAVITHAHGIRGEVRLKVFAEDPRSLVSYSPLHTADGRTFEVSRIKVLQNDCLASLTGVSDRNAAESLRGTELFVARGKLGEAVLLSDLMGRTVTSAAVSLGVVTGFHNFGAGDLMELDTGLLIPTRFIQSTDDAIHVALPDGFVEPDEKE
jgi:16S rRNA processing protein RimM